MKSSLTIRTQNISGRTSVTESSFTSPIKIAKPFYYDDHTEVMMMAASAGMLEGDNYDISIHTGENCSMKFTSQSYTKVFRSEAEGSSQNVDITVGRGGKLLYMPCPLIPFAESRYTARTEVHLDKNCRFAMCDILSCGRAVMNERFLFDSYRSRTAVYVSDRLVFLDNIWLKPAENELSGIGFFEDHTHAGMIYIYGADVGELPESGSYKIYEINEILSYSTVDYFTKIFRKYTGCPPSSYIASE